MKMQKAFPDDYNFIPKTWILPNDMHDFKNQFGDPRQKKKTTKTFIIKPTNACQGKGIYLVRRLEDIDLRSNDQIVA